MIFKDVIDWMEVWALLIPIVILIKKRKQPFYLKPITIYLFIALILNVLSNIIWKYKFSFNFPVILQVNTYLYSIHAILRLFLLGWFFIILEQRFLKTIKKITLLIFAFFVIINFMYEPFINYWYEKGKLQSTISTRVLATEAAIMVFFCLQYYLYNLINEQEFKKSPDFWVVTGLAIFSFCSLPIYFFYNTILQTHRTFTINIWTAQKISFLVFCLGIANAFYMAKNATNSHSKSVQA